MRRSLLGLAIIAGLGYLLIPDSTPVVVRAGLKVTPIAVLALEVSRREGIYARLILLGLVLCGIGDVVLVFPGETFVPGLASFLLGHVAYIAALVSADRRPAWPKAAPFVAWGAAAGWLLWPHLGNLKGPVMAYLVVIMTMMWRATAVGPVTPAVKAGIAGALLFGLSDTLLAINRFHTPFAGAGVAVMLTYYAGQAGISASVLLALRR